MKKLFLMGALALIVMNATAQVQGVSAEKIGAVNPSVVLLRNVEFEPAFGYLWSKKTFDDNGKLIPLSKETDSINILRALGFRFTYGFAKNFEAGGLITSDLNNFSLGVKYRLFAHKKFSGAALLGTTFSNESDIVLRNTGFFGKTASLAGGFSFANKLGKHFSVDYDFQYQNLFDGYKSYADNYYIHADAGYMLKGNHLMIAGLAWQYNHYKYDKKDAYLLTLNLGTAIMTGRTFILVFNFPFDLIGKNTDRFNGLTFALTIILD